MNMTSFKRTLSVILCIVLVAAMALCTIGCSNNTVKENPETPLGQLQQGTGDGEKTEETPKTPPKEIGEGKNSFAFTVVDINGNEAAFTVKTDKDIVGDALVEVGLIEGDAGPYGLYVKKVNGIVADYDRDKTYWGFYVDGEYAMSGVDTTKIEEGKTYTFKVSK